MESKDELKEIHIKNRTCYYFDDIIRDLDIDFDSILIDEKSDKDKEESILTYDISYKTFMNVKALRIMFDEKDGLIKVDDGIRCLVLYVYKRYNATDDRIKYLISEKSGITDSINYNFARIRIDSYNSLPIEKIFSFHNVIIFIKSVASKNKYDNCYNIF